MLMGKEFTTSQPIVALTQKLKNLTDMTVPQQVKQIANDNGCNNVVYAGTIDGYDVYSMGIVGEDGLPEPTGLPELILHNDSEYKIVTREDALALLSRLE